MDACTPVDSISEDFGPCVSNAYFCCKLTYVGPRQCSTYDSAQENVKVVPSEDLNDFQGCLINKEYLKVEELGTAISGLHVEDFLDQLSCCRLSSELEVCNLKDDTGCPKDDKQKVLQQDASDGSMKKGFSKSATFTCSEKIQPSPIPVGVEEILPSAPFRTQCSLKSGNLVYARSISLPPASKLISAMKGGRDKEGAPLKTKLEVKWAPDVYDPPATSMSHTVKNYHQRPKAKKKDHHKYKHKNKSSRGSTREKKHVNQTNICSNANPQYSRLQVPESSSVIDVSAQSSVRALDYVASSQESKCGSSFLVGSLAKLHFTVAEAT